MSWDLIGTESTSVSYVHIVDLSITYHGFETILIGSRETIQHKKQSCPLQKNRLGADPPTVLLNFQKIFRCQWHSSVLQALLSFRVFLVLGIYSSRSLHGPFTLLAWDYIAVWIWCDGSDWMTTDKLIKSTLALSLNFQVRSLQVGDHPTWCYLYHINFGPAALTLWYQGYYDTWLRGQYIWKIREMHAQYGECVPSSRDCWSHWVKSQRSYHSDKPIWDPYNGSRVYRSGLCWFFQMPWQVQVGKQIHKWVCAVLCG